MRSVELPVRSHRLRIDVRALLTGNAASPCPDLVSGGPDTPPTSHLCSSNSISFCPRSLRRVSALPLRPIRPCRPDFWDLQSMNQQVARLHPSSWRSRFAQPIVPAFRHFVHFDQGDAGGVVGPGDLGGVGTGHERDEQRRIGGGSRAAQCADLREGGAERGRSGPAGVGGDDGVLVVDRRVQFEPRIRERPRDTEGAEGGADATMSSVRGTLPERTKPAMSVCAPVPAKVRAERLTKRACGTLPSASYASTSATPVPPEAEVTCAE